MKAFVTGGAGFVGSNLVDRLVEDGNDVVIYDNFSTGREEFIAAARQSGRVHIVSGDVLDRDALTAAMRGCDVVCHLAANADVRWGTLHPDRDLQQNVLATFNVLEAMRALQIRTIAFSSTGSIYGEPEVFPTPEDAPFPVQTSIYGASKLACEGLISAYCEGYDMRAFIFRFVSVLGERYTHGHVFDFVKHLRAHPESLRILGNGKQRKSYIYVRDCVDGIVLAMRTAQNRVNILNVGVDDYCEVTDSVQWITQHMAVSPKLEFTGGDRGWVGDSPFIFLDCSKMRSLGWRPAVSIRDAVTRTVDYLQANAWLLESRT
jgi:UDP-glucose 4-epimerase